MNINNYNYSLSNAIGSSLRQPLFQLVSNIAIAQNNSKISSHAKYVANIALRYFIAITLIIPASIAWSVGKVFYNISKTQIDPEGLYLAPPPLKIPQVDESLDINLLSQKFNALDLETKVIPGKTSKRDCLKRLCSRISEEEEQIYPDAPNQRTLFCKQASAYLKDFVKKINDETLSPDKARDLLLELAEASTRCYPTWLEVAYKIYCEINGQTETAEVKLLRRIQDYKERIILDFAQNEVNEQWHALNFVRHILGTELGLNTNMIDFDPYAAQQNSNFNKSLCRWIFMERYENVNRLIAGIQTAINSEKYDVSYYNFLLDAVKQRGIKNPTDFVETHFYNEDYQITPSAINFMLRSIGVLK